jgi:hypothetical protein
MLIGLMCAGAVMKETPILKRILYRCSRGASRLFRNNVGTYQDKAGNWIRYGVGGPGASDLIGWRQIVITPEHVGMTLAQFLSVEVKQPGKKLTEPQARFGRMVATAGGVFGVAHSPEEAESIIKGVDNTEYKE